MATITLPKKRKNIDLPIDTLQKLSIMAASQGKSLKAFIEGLLISKAERLKFPTQVQAVTSILPIPTI